MVSGKMNSGSPGAVGKPGNPDRGVQLSQAVRKLRLRDLETLDTLGRTRSFVKTAEAAAITQPALSKWLRELEGALGLQLFERTTRRVTSTLYGDAVLECIGRILGDLHGVEPKLEALRQGLSEPLTVGVLPGITAALMPATMEALLGRAQPLQINLRENTLNVLLPLAQRRELDLLICRLDATVLAAGLTVQPLYQDDIVVVGADNHPLARRKNAGWLEAASYPWIAPPLGSPMRIALEAEFAAAGLAAPRIVMESASFQTNAAVAQRLPCLFVASRQDVSPAGRAAVRPLPLSLASVAHTVGALYSLPCSAAVTALLDALKLGAQEAVRGRA